MNKSLTNTDSITRKRLDNGETDHHICLFFNGVRIGNTGKVRWQITTCESAEDYEPEYIDELLEKIIEVIRS